jgi:hypothetical protein
LHKEINSGETMQDESMTLDKLKGDR